MYVIIYIYMYIHILFCEVSAHKYTNIPTNVCVYVYVCVDIFLFDCTSWKHICKINRYCAGRPVLLACFMPRKPPKQLLQGASSSGSRLIIVLKRYDPHRMYHCSTVLHPS